MPDEPRLVKADGSLKAKIKDLERFIWFIKVDRFSRCWNWTGDIDRKGYAKFWYNGKTGRGAQFVYKVFRGPIPKGHEPDHLCKNTSCVNPEHLDAVTRHENLIRGDSPVGINARKLRCYKGHPFNAKNTYVVMRNGHPQRSCRKCSTERTMKRYWENPEKFRKIGKIYYERRTKIRSRRR